MHIDLTIQFEGEEEMWPPIDLKTFTPLLLMHYRGQHNLKQATTMAKLAHSGTVDDIPLLANNQSIPLQYCNQYSNHKSLKEVFDDRAAVTTELVEVLTHLELKDSPCFVLIEGPPGIGKSVLLKELFCKLKDKQWLESKNLVKLLKNTN